MAPPSAEEEKLYLEKVEEEAVRYENLDEYLTEVSDAEERLLSPEDRKLFSVACQEVSNSALDLRYLLLDIEDFKLTCSTNHVEMINILRSRIQQNLSKICDKVSNPTIKSRLDEFKAGAGDEEESVLNTFIGFKPDPSEELEYSDVYDGHDHSKCIEQLKSQVLVPRVEIDYKRQEMLYSGRGSESSQEHAVDKPAKAVVEKAISIPKPIPVEKKPKQQSTDPGPRGPLKLYEIQVPFKNENQWVEKYRPNHKYWEEERPKNLYVGCGDADKCCPACKKRKLDAPESK